MIGHYTTGAHNIIIYCLLEIQILLNPKKIQISNLKIINFEFLILDFKGSIDGISWVSVLNIFVCLQMEKSLDLYID